MRDKRLDEHKPDPHALEIARAVQEEVSPATVILFGSRAAGDYCAHSDVDLLVIAQAKENHKTARDADAAASGYMRNYPPRLDVSIVIMTRDDFVRNRRAKQHLAGQAAHHGVVMNGEGLEYGADYEDEYPIHWPATKKRLENAAEWSHEFNEMVDRNHWNQKVIGFAAQQAVENALKGWLSTFNDPSRFGHDLNELWSHLERIQNWDEPGTGQLRESLIALFEHIQYNNPSVPGGKGNWLAAYSDVYRYDVNPRRINREEKRELQRLVNGAVESMMERIHQVSGTGCNDIFTEGTPWE